jgi:hypothetical protein
MPDALWSSPTSISKSKLIVGEEALYEGNLFCINLKAAAGHGE